MATVDHVIRHYTLFGEHLANTIWEGMCADTTISDLIDYTFKTLGVDVATIDAYGEYYISVVTDDCLIDKINEGEAFIKTILNWAECEVLDRQRDAKLSAFKDIDGIIRLDRMKREDKQRYTMFCRIHDVYSYLIRRAGRKSPLYGNTCLSGIIEQLMDEAYA